MDIMYTYTRIHLIVCMSVHKINMYVYVYAYIYTYIYVYREREGYIYIFINNACVYKCMFRNIHANTCIHLECMYADKNASTKNVQMLFWICAHKVQAHTRIATRFHVWSGQPGEAGVCAKGGNNVLVHNSNVCLHWRKRSITLC